MTSSRTPKNRQPAPHADPKIPSGQNRNRYSAPFGILLAKELRETYRDRRTIVTLVVMPLLLYPIISLLAYNFLPKPKLDTKAEGFRIVFDSADSYELIFPKIQAGHRNLIQKGNPTNDLPPSPNNPYGNNKSKPEDSQNQQPSSSELLDKTLGAPVDIQIENLPLDDHNWISANQKESDQILLQEGEADLVISFIPEENTVRLSYNPKSSFSIRAYQFVTKRIQSADLLRAKFLSNRAGFRIPISKTTANPILITKKPGINFAALVPLILIMMTITGAVYPAIDLTAGERERGTLETLVASPISKTSLLGAKFLAVWSVAMMTALVNIASLSITLWVFQLDTSLLGPAGLSFALILKVFLLLGLFALFFSAILLLLTSFAKSFKEAQAYLVPLMVFSLAPAMAGLSPSVQLTASIALVPMVNLVLLTRDLIQGTVMALPATISVLSSLLYAASILSITSRTFGSDAILYRTGSWKDYFSKKSDHTTPSPSIALTILAVMFPVQFILLGVMGRSLTNLSPLRQVISVAGGTVLIFLATPLLFITSGRFRWIPSFGIRWPGFAAIFAAGILGFSLWPVTAGALWAIGNISAWISPAGNEDWITSISSIASRQVETWSNVPTWALILCLAVTPAVCEELFFRGILFQALSKGNKKWFPIIATSVAFGLFHFITESSVAPLRFFVTMTLGGVLGWVAYQTRSVLPGIILHAINNSILLQLAILKHRNQTSEVLSESSYWSFIGFGLIVLVLLSLGFWLLLKTTPKIDES